MDHTTFPTEVHIESQQLQRTSQFEELRKAAAQDFRLPSSVNYIALRESLLSEAPFVSKTNKSFWRRMVDEPHYQNVLAASFRHVLNCISDVGTVNIDKLLDMKNSPFISVMALNISEMIFELNLRERDQFFAKLPEVTIFMIIEALHTSTPKHYRVYNSTRFREILLDWSSELLTGIRQTNCKAGREWIFSSATDSNIMTSTTKLPNIRPNQGNATSLYSLEHSPLVRLYMGLDATGPEPGGFGFKAALSHAPERPLTVMNDYCVLREGKSHARKCDISAVRRQLKDTMKHRKSIMNDFTKSKELAATDIRRMREAYHTHLDHLANKKVSKKQLVAAMQANSTA